MPELSYIIPIYNNQENICILVDMLKKHEFKNFECAIIDDLSQDRSIEYAKKAIGSDKRFYVVASKTKSGLPAAINLGLLYVNGKFVKILFPDQLFSKTMMSALLNARNHKLPNMFGIFNQELLPEPIGFFTRHKMSSCRYLLAHPPLVKREYMLGIGFNEKIDMRNSMLEFLQTCLLNNLVLIAAKSIGVQNKPAFSQDAMGQSLNLLPDTPKSFPYSINPLLTNIDSDDLLANSASYPVYSAPWQRSIDIAFFPHKDYHAYTVACLQEQLQKRSINFIVVDLSSIYRDEGTASAVIKYNLPSVSLPKFLCGDYAAKCIAVFNDWDPTVTRPAMSAARDAGIIDLAIVEGVQDYHDVDTGRDRKAYKSSGHIITPCKFDLHYFKNSHQKVYEGSIPRIADLAAEAPKHPWHATDQIVINSNFSYTSAINAHRDAWNRDAVAACEELGLPYVISRHPADIGDFSKYKVTTQTMYDAIWNGSIFISRFGSGVIEAIAMNRPVIYFNPHGEKIDKFMEPLGAYYIANSKEALKQYIIKTLNNIDILRHNWLNFLKMHAGYDINQPSLTYSIIADSIEKLLKDFKFSNFRQRKKFSEIFSSRFKKSDSYFL